VKAFNGELRECARYRERLKGAQGIGERTDHVHSAGLGLSSFFIYAMFAIGFWYGGILITQHLTTGGSVLNVFYACFLGAQALSSGSNMLSTVHKSRAAASIPFRVINRIPSIDLESTPGSIIHQLKGDIEFHQVKFSYPTRSDTIILNQFNVKLDGNSAYGIAGPSGSGKTTLIQLLLRFYDVNEGKITLDGIDIKELNLKWLRRQIGIVGQDSELFEGTISENVAFGMEGCSDDPVSQEDIIRACQQAHIHDTILTLPEGYNTRVGEGGALLSGGQKQRICIARAIIKNPKILILDEATSALDPQSEQSVKEAIDQVSQNRTTIVIAHRLSTLQKTNCILVLSNGQIVESGSHNELISKSDGIYYNLVRTQSKSMDDLHDLDTPGSALRTPRSIFSPLTPTTPGGGIPKTPIRSDGGFLLPHPTRRSTDSKRSRSTKLSIDTNRSSLEGSGGGGGRRKSRKSLDIAIRKSIEADTKRSIAEVDEREGEFIFSPLSPLKERVSHDYYPRQQFSGISSMTPISPISPTTTSTSTQPSYLTPPATMSFIELLQLNRKEWHLLLGGTIASAIRGCVTPSFSVVLSQLLGSLSITDTTELQKQATLWALIILLIAMAEGVSLYVKAFFFELAGERITLRLRDQCYTKILQQPMEWFDKEDHSPGVLVTQLSVDSQRVRGMVTAVLGNMVIFIVCATGGLIYAFIIGWELTAVGIACIPLMILAGRLQLRMLEGYENRTRRSYEISGAIASEVSFDFFFLLL